VKDVLAIYDKLVNLFERIRYFLGRLDCYSNIQLKPPMAELLVKIMAEVLHILAISTKTMKEGRISEPIHRIILSLSRR
jgi:hypothetical protein